MDDLHAQFVIAVGDTCAAAALAMLEVEVVLRAGDRFRGVPRAPRHARGRDEVDDSGYERTLTVDDHTVELEEIVACTLHAPAASDRRADGGFQRRRG